MRFRFLSSVAAYYTRKLNTIIFWLVFTSSYGALPRKIKINNSYLNARKFCHLYNNYMHYFNVRFCSLQLPDKNHLKKKKKKLKNNSWLLKNCDTNSRIRILNASYGIRLNYYILVLTADNQWYLMYTYLCDFFTVSLRLHVRRLYQIIMIRVLGRSMWRIIRSADDTE
jgi:hypothetical protein